MKILLAPDSFKGSLSAVQFCQVAERAILQVFADATVRALPLSDGGEGFVESFVYAKKAENIRLMVADPVGRKTFANFAWQAQTKTAMIEMAQASGLPKLRADEKNPLRASSYGTGQLIQAALDKGAKRIVLGLGGSATNDGGVGALQALGVEILDAQQQPVGLGGQALREIAQIGAVPEALKQVEWVLACDVTNPLLGEMGATAVFGPQKGVNEHNYQFLENGMQNWAQQLEQRAGCKVAEVPGAGAAGGMAAGFIGVLGAKVEPGFDVLKQALAIEQSFAAESWDLVITGEGRIDEQTRFGKLPMRIAQLCTEHQIPCIGLCGSLGVAATEMPEFATLMSIVNQPMDVIDAMRQGAPLLHDTVASIMNIYRLGRL